MSALAWARTVCDAAYRSGFLTVAASQRAQWLIQDGLHPEQALIGTGLLTVEQYIALIQQVFSFGLTKLDQDAFARAESLFKTSLFDESRLLALTHEDGQTVVAAADLWDWPEEQRQLLAEQAKKRSFEVVPTFLSDIQAFLRLQQQPISSLQPVVQWAISFQEQMKKKNGQAIQLIATEPGAVQGRLDEIIGSNESLVQPQFVLPALHAAFELGPIAPDWSMVATPLTSGDHLMVTHRLGTNHPAHRLELFSRFWQQESGSLICLEPDAFVRRFVQEHAPLWRQNQSWKEAPDLVSVQLSTDEAWLEEVTHQLLSGRRLCVFATVHQIPILRELASAHIPLHVLRARRVAGKTVWESYSL